MLCFPPAMRRTSLLLGLCGGALLSGCGDDGSGVTTGGQMMYTTHGSVSDGLSPVGDVIAAPGDGVFGVQSGGGVGQIRDGWTVEYQKILVSLGTVTFTTAAQDDIEVAADFVIDLQSLPVGGTLLERTDVRERARKVAFTLPQASSGRTRPLAPYTLEQDAKLMVDGGYAIYVEGTIEKATGMSCRPDVPSDCVPAPLIRFRWGLPHGVAYDDCEWIDSTVANPSVTLTFPAIDWLHTAVGADSPTLRAQWIADADLDRDGETTLDELQAIDAATLLTRRRGYDLSGAIDPIATVYDFLREQTRALGLRSWGRCGSASNL
ncbi:hypothetical protein OV203_10540 [Nannocystis sp. ILAH1]|uniref:hypothetical protein n=2 Tax=unclassified Nannocystis TaxID=2627009 RepID=UPI00226DE431|nr:hypothetical protein [Nannocystis sp. ILAH1]MCY0987563.1 hypothetical protein [Nannocystis sp. ILAH1]